MDYWQSCFVWEFSHHSGYELHDEDEGMERERGEGRLQQTDKKRGPRHSMHVLYMYVCIHMEFIQILRKPAFRLIESG